MKFLSHTTLPKLTITRTRRKAVFNHISDITTMYETTTRIEVTLPSIVRGIKEKINQFADTIRSAFLPRVYAY